MLVARHVASASKTRMGHFGAKSPVLPRNFCTNYAQKRILYPLRYIIIFLKHPFRSNKFSHVQNICVLETLAFWKHRPPGCTGILEVQDLLEAQASWKYGPPESTRILETNI